LISVEDAFSISHEGTKLIGYPDNNFLNYNWIKINFDENSRKILLEKRRKSEQLLKKTHFNMLPNGQIMILKLLKKGKGYGLRMQLLFAFSHSGNYHLVT